MISVVVCCWNSKVFLPQTLKSLVEQTNQDFEVVFVDGGSEDGTLDLIAAYSGKKTILNNVRGGIANAMNQGIEAAKGEIVAHLHSDDYYENPNTLAIVADVFAKQNCQWLFGRIKSDIDGHVIPEAYQVPRYTYSKFLQGNFIPHPATFIRRSVFAELGKFNGQLKYAMDYDLFLRIGRQYDPVQLDQHLAVFRRHDGSTTQANFMQSFAEDFKVRCQYAKWHQLPEAYLKFWVRRRRHLQRLAQQASH